MVQDWWKRRCRWKLVSGCNAAKMGMERTAVFTAQLQGAGLSQDRWPELDKELLRTRWDPAEGHKAVVAGFWLVDCVQLCCEYVLLSLQFLFSFFIYCLKKCVFLRLHILFCFLFLLSLCFGGMEWVNGCMVLSRELG